MFKKSFLLLFALLINAQVVKPEINWEFNSKIAAGLLATGALGSLFFGSPSEDATNNLYDTQDFIDENLEKLAIDLWITQNNLNRYGEPLDTVYEDTQNGPLKMYQSRYEYVRWKFQDEHKKPWDFYIKKIRKIRKHAQQDREKAFANAKWYSSLRQAFSAGSLCLAASWLLGKTLYDQHETDKKVWQEWLESLKAQEAASAE